jgi:hypothetical protein
MSLVFFFLEWTPYGTQSHTQITVGAKSLERSYKSFPPVHRMRQGRDLSI